VFSSTTDVGSVFVSGLSAPQYLALTSDAGQPLSLPVLKSLVADCVNRSGRDFR
jgi:hypothetical protein